LKRKVGNRRFGVGRFPTVQTLNKCSKIEVEFEEEKRAIGCRNKGIPKISFLLKKTFVT